MKTPSYHDYMHPIWQIMLDGKLRTRKEIFELVVKQLGYGEKELSDQTPGGAPRVKLNCGWAVSDLKLISGILSQPGHGKYKITEIGKSLYAEAPDYVTRAWLKTHPLEQPKISEPPEDNEKPPEVDKQLQQSKTELAMVKFYGNLCSGPIPQKAYALISELAKLT